MADHTPEIGMPVRHEITSQGAPIVNGGHVDRTGCVLLSIDMRSKRCDVLGWGDSAGIPLVQVFAVDESLHLMDGVPRYAPTTIEFPEFKGWTVLSADIGRYTLRVYLAKEESNHGK